MGDFNHPEIDWLSESCYQSANHPSTIFLNVIHDTFFYQHCAEPTHSRPGQRANTLHLVFTSEEGLINNLIYCSPLGKSDHSTLQFQLTCSVVPECVSTKKFNYNKVNYEGMQSYLREVDWDSIISTGTSADECWSQIESQLKEARDRYVPCFTHKQGDRKKPPWMDAETKASMKSKAQLYRKYRRTKKPDDYIEYRKVRNKAKSDLRKAVLNYEKKLAKEARNNPKAFYRYINSKTKSRCSNGTLETKQGELIEGNRHKAEALNKHFSSVFTREGLGELPHFSQRSCQNQLQDMTFDASEIKDKLLNLKTNKSPGPDKIHPRLLKEMHSVLSVPLQKLFTRLLQLGCPEAWKVGHITPVFKKGNKKDVSNYSLTSVTGKVMESFVRSRLMKHFTYVT